MFFFCLFGKREKPQNKKYNILYRFLCIEQLNMLREHCGNRERGCLGVLDEKLNREMSRREKLKAIEEL